MMPDSRDVFRLRKEGRFGEALDTARQIFPQTPTDPWVIKAYGWSLHDCLKLARDANDVPQIRELAQEFASIEIPADDEVLIGARENWRSHIPPEDGGPALADLLQEAKHFSDEGSRHDALKLLRDAVKQFPESQQASTSLGWEIQRSLGELVAQDDFDGQSVRSLLLEYSRLLHLKKPDNLHSLMLRRATRAAEKGKFGAFIRFFRWWGPENLQPDDFQRFAPQDADRTFDSLIEHVIKSIHKTTKSEEDREVIKWAAEFMGAHYASFPEQDWFPYYYGQILVRSGDLEHARALVLPIVRAKRSEFWAWHSLSATFGAEQTESIRSCLCRALQCSVQDKSFLVNVHFELAQIFVSLGQFPEAKYEAERAVEIRSTKNWELPQPLLNMQAASWYQDAVTPASNDGVYNQYGPSAEQILYEALPSLQSVVVNQIPSSKERLGLTFIGYVCGGKLLETGVKSKQFECLESVSAGQAIFVRIDDSGPRPVVVSVERREAEPWDIIDPKIGVVQHVNRDKGVTTVVLGRDVFCLFHHDRFPQMRTIGPGVVVAVKSRLDEKRNMLRALSYSVTDETPPSSFCKHFVGRLTVNDSGRFGFVNHDVYIPGHLIEKVKLASGDSIHGTAILELNKPKNEYGWRALAVEKKED